MISLPRRRQAEDWTVGADRDLPIDSSETWDGDAAKASIFAWAGFDDDDPDPSKAKRGFLIYDAANAELKGSYKLPFAHYIGGLKASPAGLRAAASRLPQTDAPQDVLDRARAVIDHYYERMEEDSYRPAKRGNRNAPPFVIKQAEIEVGEDRSGHFIASTNREDRYGDIIEQDWDLADFWRNPTFLWGHQSWQTPIGWVREFDPNYDRSATHARVEFLPEGEDPFVDKLYRLTKLKALRAVSVGFIPLELEERFDADDHWVGFRFLRSQLIELSLVTVPANPDAVQLARSIDPHPAFLRRVFPEYRPTRAPSAIAPESVGYPRRTLASRTLARLKADPSSAGRRSA
jgi:HK97 family phage prohead protease